MALAAAALPFVCLSGSPANAQSVIRTPSLHVEPRAPSINSNIHRGSIPTLAPSQLRGPRRPASASAGDACGASHRRTVDDAQCALFAEPLSGLRIRLSRQRRRMPRPSCCPGDGGGEKGVRQRRAMAARARQRGADRLSTCRPFPNELVAEIDGALTDRQVEELARRHGRTRLEGHGIFPLLGCNHRLVSRITDRRPADAGAP